jgi:hypothetical protein
MYIVVLDLPGGQSMHDFNYLSCPAVLLLHPPPNGVPAALQRLGQSTHRQCPAPDRGHTDVSMLPSHKA